MDDLTQDLNAKVRDLFVIPLQMFKMGKSKEFSTSLIW